MITVGRVGSEVEKIILLAITIALSTSCVTYGPFETNPQPGIYTAGIDSNRGDHDPRFQKMPDDPLPRISDPTEMDAVKVLGHITVKKVFLHPFYFAFPTRQRDALHKAALKQAETLYGSEIDPVVGESRRASGLTSPWSFCCLELDLANLQYESDIHISTVLLGAGLFGWVEKATLEAVVVLESSTQDVMPSYLVYHLVSPNHFNLRFLYMCFR
jgi:hypothetical protein